MYDDFKKLVESSLAFADLHEERVILDQISVDKACNWQVSFPCFCHLSLQFFSPVWFFVYLHSWLQETSTRFIHRLSEEFASYNDIIQPIQVSIYEMKLGLSIVVSNTLLEIFLNQFPGYNAKQIQVSGLCEQVMFYLLFGFYLFWLVLDVQCRKLFVTLFSSLDSLHQA